MSESAAATPAGPTSAPVATGSGDAPQPPQRRTRGRPFGSRTKNPPLAENAVPPEAGTAPGATAGEEPNRRRRRSKAIDKEALAKQLVSMHEMIARLTNIGLIQISMQEGLSLADALESMSREYDMALDGKTGALIQLLFAAGVVYGPRVMMYQAVKKQEKQRQAAAHAAEAAAGTNGHATPDSAAAA